MNAPPSTSPSLSSQLALDFEHRPALGGDDFLVATPNAEAVRWLDAWPDWPGPALVIFGPAGSGKTHLAEVFRSKSGARPVGLRGLGDEAAPALMGDARACVLEDAEAAVARSLEEPLLHLYNHVKESSRHILLTAKQPPARWGIVLADLVSRLNTAVQAGIRAPDDALITAVLVKQFTDRQLKVDVEVISYMLTRMERSFDAARRMVGTIADLALEERRNITVPLVRRVLDNF